MKLKKVNNEENICTQCLKIHKKYLIPIFTQKKSEFYPL